MARPPLRPLVALARARLARAPGARVALPASAIVAIVGAGTALALHGDGGALGALVARTGAWATWLAGGPVALAAAHGRALRDREEGIEELAAMRGASPLRLEIARLAAAMLQVALVVAAPIVAVALLSAGLASGGQGIAHALSAAVLGVGFAAITGVTLGGVAAFCGRARAGRALFAVVVLGPWLVADALGQGAWSIPGALAAALHVVGGGIA